MFRPLAASLLLLCAAAAGAQTVFGVSTQSFSSATVIYEITADNFPPRPIVSIPVTYSLVAFDPATDRAFFISAGLQGRLVIADLRTATVTITSIPSAGTTFAFDATTHRLFAIAAQQLIVVDTGTVVMTFPRDYTLLAIDGAHNRAWITERGDTTTQALYAVDLNSRTIGPALAPMEVNEKVRVDVDGSAIVIRKGPNFSIGVIERVNPVTGARTTILPQTPGLRFTEPAFDPFRRVLYLTSWRDFGLTSIMALDVASGTLSEGPMVSGDVVDLAFGSPLVPVPRRRAVRR